MWIFVPFDSWLQECNDRWMILSCYFQPFSLDVLFITNLPEYHDGCYTEADVATLLVPFGFRNVDENMYVIPQTCMVGIRLQYKL